MRIAQIAPLYEPVPPKLYGGTERVVSTLTNELVRRGHDVTLFASGDSNTPARLIPGAARALRLATNVVDKLAPHIAMLAHVEEMAGEFEVIHNHCDYFAFPFMRHWTTPSLTTLHGRLDIPELPLVYRRYPEAKLVSISNGQRAPLEPFRPKWLATVHNGIDTARFPFSPDRGDYLVFLGRVGHEKRPDIAVEVARRAGMPLKIAAKIDAADAAWHEAVLKPMLQDPLVEFIGEIDDEEKGRLLQGAAALLFPSSWPEPFGIAMIEAMACGAPVIGLRYGAVPEVVDHGRTGFVCDSIDEMVAAIDRLGEIDRSECRRRVDTTFSSAAMAAGYEVAYQRAIELDARPASIAGTRVIVSGERYAAAQIISG